MHTLRFAAWLPAAALLTAAEPLVRIPPVRSVVEIGGQPVSIAASGEVSAAEHPNLYTISLLGQMAAIGHGGGIANIVGFQFSGFPAWCLWRSIYLYKLPGLQKKGACGIRLVAGRDLQ